MAERRMLSKIISVSEKVNKLPDIFDMLLFTWMIPHADDFGRLAGSPFKVKNLVVPSIRRIEEADIEVSLGHLQAAGLIYWYTADKDKVVQIVNFEEHQQGLHKRTKSKFPDPPINDSEAFPEVPGKSEEVPKIPSELNRTELNGTELNGTEENRTEGNGKEQQHIAKILPDDPLFRPLGTEIDSSSCSKPDINLFDIFEREGFGTISPFTSDKIQTLEKDYGARWVQEAMKIAALNGKRKLVYVDGILINWKADGIDEPWTKEAPPGNGGNKSKGRNGKPIIDVVQPETDPDKSELSDEEYEQMMRFAQQMQASKQQQEVPH